MHDTVLASKPSLSTAVAEIFYCGATQEVLFFFTKHDLGLNRDSDRLVAETIFAVKCLLRTNLIYGLLGL